MDAADTLRANFEHSGLAALWSWARTWLALDERQLIFVIATPVFIGVALWEYLRIRHDPSRMDAREAVHNFGLGAGYQITELLFAGLIAVPVYAFAYDHRWFTLELNAGTALLLFVLTDLCFYVMHRAAHRVRWFWCGHVTHHSSERMNFSTAMRQNATNIFNGNWLFYVPLALLGFEPSWIGVAYALSLVYQFFIHTTLIGELHPWLEFVLNTPRHHRVHHASNDGYIDTNYGGVFIVFDRLFGSFAEEKAEAPIRYGITRPVATTSLWLSWLHEYRDMFRDMTRPGSPGARLLHLWMPPEWVRTEHGQTSSLRDQAAEKAPAAGAGATHSR
jgi:sterol desaturase/sphingolipid hydroxylase (fatty acid hydroxylase superfamily)